MISLRIPGVFDNGRAARTGASGDAVVYDRIFAALMGLMVAVVALTASDYGISVDEYLFDTYGVQSLNYYVTFGADRSSFDWYDDFLYGPWFHIIVAWVQSFDLMAPFDMRHLMTGLLSLFGLGGTYALGRRIYSGRVGLVAVGLLLLTGNFYGHMFNSPVDAPFAVVMTWATLVLVATFDGDGRWQLVKVLLSGVLIGLAIATRIGGLLLLAYLGGIAGLAAIDRLRLAVEPGRTRPPALSVMGAIGGAVVAAAVSAATTWATWPWIQEDPLGRLKLAFSHFAHIGMTYDSLVWGIPFRTSELPWFYIPLNLVGRLAEPFAILLIGAVILGGCGAWQILRRAREWGGGAGRVVVRVMAELARRRGEMLVIAAGIFPLVYAFVSGAVLYDGIRHLLFTVPMLALLAARAGDWLWPRLKPVAVPAAAVAGGIVGFCLWAVVTLHPDEYIRISAFAGGTRDGAPRFESDYWGIGVAEGVERLREFLDLESQNGRPVDTPRVLVAVSWREQVSAAALPPEWQHVDSVEAADFVIAPTRWSWEPPPYAQAIAEVQRQGIVLAMVYDLRR